MGIAPAWVQRGRSNHNAAQSRLAAHGARRCEQQAGCVGAPPHPGGNRRKCAAEPLGLQLSSAKGGRAGGSHRIAKCNAKCDSSHLYFEIKHNGTGKCTMGFLARAGSEPRPGSERRRPAAAGRRPVPSTGQNIVLPAHSSLRPPFTAEERKRSGRTRSWRNRPADQRPAAYGGRPGGGVRRAANQ